MKQPGPPEPTPDPSLEGNGRCVCDNLFPSWEGSGVGFLHHHKQDCIE